MRKWGFDGAENAQLELIKLWSVMGDDEKMILLQEADKILFEELTLAMLQRLLDSFVSGGEKWESSTKYSLL